MRPFHPHPSPWELLRLGTCIQGLPAAPFPIARVIINSGRRPLLTFLNTRAIMG